MLDYRLYFPLLNRVYEGKPLQYFDNAATTPKPQVVIDAVNEYYNLYNANVHRGPNFLSEEATNLYESSRSKVAAFIGADREEIIFTSGATFGFNLVARSWGEQNLKKGDVIALSRAEHHANLVPWLQLKEKIGIVIEYIDLNDEGTLSADSLDKIFAQPKLRLIAITLASNVLGQYYNLEPLIKRAKIKNIITVVDAAQAIAHRSLDVKILGADFVSFSGHKLFAPSGIGVLYGRKELLEKMPSFLGGGNMISEVLCQSFKPAVLPNKFEAGTPNIEGAIALGTAIDFIKKIGWQEIISREENLSKYFIQAIKKLDFVKVLGGEEGRLPVFALSLTGFHPHDAADLLGERGIIVRAGHHCAQPIHDYFKVKASLRASLSFYNTTEEIDNFIVALSEIKEIFKN
ncbi:MAG: SufS family cysteine desulfurase [Patescibacteria group bacterium]|nr:SufS family cysteine desulfurase [Patescibacteria group bacterium]